MKRFIMRAAQAMLILVIGLTTHAQVAKCEGCEGYPSCPSQWCESCPATWYGSCKAGLEGCFAYYCDYDGECSYLADSCLYQCYCAPC